MQVLRLVHHVPVKDASDSASEGSTSTPIVYEALPSHWLAAQRQKQHALAQYARPGGNVRDRPPRPACVETTAAPTDVVAATSHHGRVLGIAHCNSIHGYQRKVGAQEKHVDDESISPTTPAPIMFLLKVLLAVFALIYIYAKYSH